MDMEGSAAAQDRDRKVLLDEVRGQERRGWMVARSVTGAGLQMLDEMRGRGRRAWMA